MRYSWLIWVMLMIALPAHAQEFAKYDTRLPIEITADSLEVLQQDRKAIFKGNVVAIQGKMRLRSDVMVVTYRQGDDKGEGLNTISRIDVSGNVFLATPEETAKGDKGLYNVDRKTITMQGAIVLTKGKNVLKGNDLEYNLSTGKSLVTGSGGMSVDGQVQPGGRVRGLFVPEQGGQ